MPSNDNTTKHLAARVPAEEAEEFKAVATLHGLTVSAALRFAIAQFGELGRIAWLDFNPDAAAVQLGSAEQVAEERRRCEAALHELWGVAFRPAPLPARNAAFN